jgi:hypothetical protein
VNCIRQYEARHGRELHFTTQTGYAAERITMALHKAGLEVMHDPPGVCVNRYTWDPDRRPPILRRWERYWRPDSKPGKERARQASLAGEVITSQLTAIARDHNLCVIGVMHLKKGEGPAIERVKGSGDWVGAARALWVVDKDSKNPDRRRMTPGGINHAGDKTAFAYSIQGTVIEGDIEVGKIVWEDSSFSQTADQALGEKSEDKSAEDEAIDFLRAMLSKGPVPSSQLLAEAKRLDIAKPTLDRAKKKLGGSSVWDGGQYLWTLPLMEAA